MGLKGEPRAREDDMKTGTAESYRVFVRNWWRWTHNDTGRRLVPDSDARKTTLGRGMTDAEALAMCREYAASHKPGPLSRRAEYERE